MTKRKSPDFSDFLEWLQQFVRRRGQRTVGAARACESGGTWRVWRDPRRATASSAIGNFARQKAVNEWSRALSNLLFTVGHGSFYFKLLITSRCFGLPLFFFSCASLWEVNGFSRRIWELRRAQSCVLFAEEQLFFCQEFIPWEHYWDPMIHQQTVAWFLR